MVYHIMNEHVDGCTENGVAVPEVLALCEDASVIGTPFYIMRYIPGRIFKDPTLPGEEAASRRDIYDAIVRTLASIHDVRIDQPGMSSGMGYHAWLPTRYNKGHGPDAGLKDFGKHEGYFERQVKTWTKQSQASIMAPPGG
jgi:acyl-CoA dehydrogenase family protein 10